MATYQAIEASGTVSGDAAENQRWILESSKAAGQDLIPFYEQWKLPVEPATRTAVAALGLAPIKFNVSDPCGGGGPVDTCAKCCSGLYTRVYNSSGLAHDAFSFPPIVNSTSPTPSPSVSPSPPAASPSPSVSPPPSSPSPSPGPGSIACPSCNYTDTLGQHNAYRTQHATPALTYSAAIAATSDAYAANCAFAHDPNNTAYGENLYFAAGYGLSSETALAAATTAWYDEIKVRAGDNLMHSLPTARYMI